MFLNQLAMEPTTFEFFKYLRNRNVRDVEIGGGDFGSCCFDDFGLLFGLDALTLFADCVVVVFRILPIGEFTLGEDSTTFTADLDSLFFVASSHSAIFGGALVAP